MVDDRVSCVTAYGRLWRSDVTDEEVDQLLYPAFVAHTPAEQGTGWGEFKGHL
jgi:hypothetical protein